MQQVQIGNMLEPFEQPVSARSSHWEQSMQHLILYFRHDVRDLIPWSEFIETLRPVLALSGKGEFASDDMAIDGGDCEAIFRGPDVEALFEILRPQLRNLPFLRKSTTKVEFVFGELGSSAETKVVVLKS